MNNFLRAPGTPQGANLGAITDVDASSPVNGANQTSPYGKSGSANYYTNYLTGGIALAEITAPANTSLLFEGIPAKITSTSNGYYSGYTSRNGDWTWAAGYYKTADNCRKLIDPNGTYGEFCQTKGLDAFHNGVDNYLFCDGHVKGMTPVKEGWVPTTNDPGVYFTKHCRGNAACP